ncbi:MAG: hypothetical protein QOH86_88, partial [Sphingomonadales bacterium]|nr:hypothetical protein [Sphingomonadales bacterium]
MATIIDTLGGGSGVRPAGDERFFLGAAVA